MEATKKQFKQDLKGKDKDLSLNAKELIAKGVKLDGRKEELERLIEERDDMNY